MVTNGSDMGWCPGVVAWGVARGDGMRWWQVVV